MIFHDRTLYNFKISSKISFTKRTHPSSRANFFYKTVNYAVNHYSKPLYRDYYRSFCLNQRLYITTGSARCHYFHSLISSLLFTRRHDIFPEFYRLTKICHVTYFRTANRNSRINEKNNGTPILHSRGKLCFCFSRITKVWLS